jgi:hypothetical protein
MIIILGYTIIQFEYIKYRDYVYPDAAYGKLLAVTNNLKQILIVGIYSGWMVHNHARFDAATNLGMLCHHQTD